MHKHKKNLPRFLSFILIFLACYHFFDSMISQNKKDTQWENKTGIIESVNETIVTFQGGRQEKQCAYKVGYQVIENNGAKEKVTRDVISDVILLYKDQETACPFHENERVKVSKLDKLNIRISKNNAH